MNKRILLVINPKSGRKKRDETFLQVENILARHGDLNTLYTQSRGHAADIAKKSKDYDRIICMGGDGTLSEICNGLMTLQKEERPEIGYIPTGSTNDFARGIGLSKNIKQNAALAASGQASPIDIGSFKADDKDEKFFTYVASFGAFTKVSYATNQNIKNRLGHLAYIFEGIKSITDLDNFKPFKLSVETNDTVLEDEYIFGAITNSTSIAGLVKLDKRNVDVNDGVFEILLIRKPKNIFGFTSVITDIISKKYNYDRIIFAHTDKLILTSETPLAFTLDGEYAGKVTHTEINVIPSAVNVVRPDCDTLKKK